MLEFNHLKQLPILLSVLLVEIKSGIGTKGEVSRLEKCFILLKAVFPVLVLLFVAFLLITV